MEITSTNTPRGNELGIGAKSYKCPDVPITKLTPFIFGDIFLFGIAE